MHKQKGATLLEFVALLIGLLLIGGWIANVVKIVGAISEPLTGLFIIRCVGVFAAPVGAVLGFI